MRLARTRPADQDGVVRRLGERQIGQLVDQLAIHRRGLEVEAGQVAVHRELGRVHLLVATENSLERSSGSLTPGSCPVRAQRSAAPAH